MEIAEQSYFLISRNIENINIKEINCFLENKKLDTDLIYSQLLTMYSSVNSYELNRPIDMIDNGNSLCSNSIKYIDSESLVKGYYSYLKSTSGINQINKKTSEGFDKYTDYFITLLTDTYFDEGMDNPAILFIAERIDENELALKDWLGKIYLKIFSNQNLLVKFLHIISDYTYEELYPVSQSIAIGCMNHLAPSVKSAAMKVFGHWRNKESLEFLLAMDEPKERWLQLKRSVLISQIKKNID